MIHVIRVETAGELEQARSLFEEYASSLEFSLDFQDFEKELATFPGAYGAPSGSILLAQDGGRPVGCVALRQLEESICEMKRLYIVPDFRGRGLGRVLAEKIIDEACRLGYGRMRLDTVRSMREANKLYAALGFEEIPPYRHNPLESALFMELVLTPRDQVPQGET